MFKYKTSFFYKNYSVLAGNW